MARSSDARPHSGRTLRVSPASPRRRAGPTITASTGLTFPFTMKGSRRVVSNGVGDAASTLKPY